MTIKLTEKDKIRVVDTDDIFGVMQRILLRDNKIDQEKEHFWMIGLNNEGYIVYIELITLGTIAKSSIAPMTIFRLAVMKNVVKVIAIHNRPSRKIQPSEDDEDATDRLIQVGIILDIILDDHLIITPKTYLSFKQIGLMDKLAESVKYVPPYVIAERMLEEKKLLVEKTLEAEEANQKAEEFRKIAEEAEQREKEIEGELKETQKEKKEIQKELNLTKQKLVKAVYSLLDKNISLEEISAILGIPLSEIEKISKEKVEE